VSLGFRELSTFDGDGRVVRADLYHDQVSMLVQLGHMPPQPGWMPGRPLDTQRVPHGARVVVRLDSRSGRSRPGRATTRARVATAV